MTFDSYAIKQVRGTFPIGMKGSQSEIPTGSRPRMRKGGLVTSISIFGRMTALDRYPNLWLRLWMPRRGLSESRADQVRGSL